MPVKRTSAVWGTVAAVAAEGLCLIGPLLMFGGELRWQSLPLRTTVVAGVSLGDAMLPLLAAARLTVSAPLVIARQALYLRQVTSDDLSDPSMGSFFRAFRVTGSAIVWRWNLWIRRTAALLLACLPATVVWGFGARVWDGAETALLFFGVGGCLLFLGCLATAVWQCRYAMAPLYLLEGYPAQAALQVSARSMRHHKAEYVDFLGQWLGRLLLCLLIVPAFVVIPRFRREQTAWLLSRRRQSAFPPTVTNGVAK